MKREAMIQGMARGMFYGDADARGMMRQKWDSLDDAGKSVWVRMARDAASVIGKAGFALVPVDTLNALANACEKGQVADLNVEERLRRLASPLDPSPENGV